jgi:hypothetical protein
MITNKINAAESIRGLACLAVVLSHLSLTFFPQMHHFDLSVVPQYPFLINFIIPHLHSSIQVQAQFLSFLF